MYLPNSEPCMTCGREPDECACGLSPDPIDFENGDTPLTEEDDFYSDWSHIPPEEDDDE